MVTCVPAALGTHDHEHTTAFALAALSLIGRRAAHPLTAMLALVSDVTPSSISVPTAAGVQPSNAQWQC
jgi:hypothetical protein